MKSIQIIVDGLVQGVGFRIATQKIALENNITGYAKNVNQHVEIEATGNEENLEVFKDKVIKGASRLSRVKNYEIHEINIKDVPNDFKTL